MKTFEEFKKWIIDEATKNDACEQGLNDANNANDYPQILEVVKKYSNWLYLAKIITTDTISEVPDEELLKANIYVKKENVIQKDGTFYYYSSSSEHFGSSTSNHYGSSSSEHYGSSSSEHYNSSSSEHYGSSTYGSVYSLKDLSIIKDSAIVRERSTGNVYFNKGKFEIVELNNN